MASELSSLPPVWSFSDHLLYLASHPWSTFWTGHCCSNQLLTSAAWRLLSGSVFGAHQRALHRCTSHETWKGEEFIAILDSEGGSSWMHAPLTRWWLAKEHTTYWFPLLSYFSHPMPTPMLGIPPQSKALPSAPISGSAQMQISLNPSLWGSQLK